MEGNSIENGDLRCIWYLKDRATVMNKIANNGGKMRSFDRERVGYGYNVQIFILKIIVNQSVRMLLKISKNSTKSKAVSSYMLSGINIKRMIQDEMAENNVSDVSIIRVSKRPIFKVKERGQREREGKESKEGSVAGSLPNKSFKIRSYNRKMKDGKEEESSEMFEKVERVRNCRANSNRIELFNLSKENRQRDENEQRIQTKIKEILQREATIKSKPPTQVFVKPPGSKLSNSPTMHYQQFSTEKYREAAYKVNAYFNPQYDQKQDKKVILVVSMEALHIHSRKPIKNSNNYDDGAIKNAQKSSAISQEQVQLLKMLSQKHYPDKIWAHTKVAFKVNSSQELQELKVVLENNNISDYYCIFYPIKKYVECWNLYQIDGLLQNTHSLILLEAKYKLKQEFPILNASTKILFVSTHNDSLVMLSRTLSAVKCLISQNTRQRMSVVDVDGDDGIEEVDEQKEDECETNICQFGIREEKIDINWAQLNARLEFIINSREMKNIHNRHQNKSVCTSKDARNKRRVLCERDSNCPLTSGKNNRNLSFNSACVEEDKWDVDILKQESIDVMRQNLLYCVRTERLKEISGQNKSIKKVQCVQRSQKCDELQQITNYVRGSCCRSKTNHQLISQLLKKNTAIHRQIQQYLTSIAHLTHPTITNSISVSNFNDCQEEESSEQVLAIHAYKIL